ncbi:MAG TPA: glycosyltransferase family 4 protein [Dehalococcoidia bacterium]|nr:glycosyltransferase family 4 protein [Dehalococcoidia bacterium]
MRIGMVSPVEMRVPPVAYGGTELVVSLLTEELVRRGHEVTLFASGDSVTNAKLVSVCDRFVRGSGRDGNILAMLNTLECFEKASEFDIIHNHTCFEGLSLAGLTRTPVLTTLHGGLEGDWLLLFKHYAGWYNTISKAMKALLPPKDRFAGVVYNAIDVKTYPFNNSRRDKGYLLFLSRMSEEKGPHIAIEVARRLDMPLLLAGNVHTADADYYLTRVLPLVDGSLVRYVGEADYSVKRDLMSHAYCLLAPITWPEPFGLFMAEAMACGTPVVAFNRGAAPEVVKNGVTGFVVDTVDQMVSAVPRVGQLDPQDCREHVERNFDVVRMADDYLAAYERILAAEARASAARAIHVVTPLVHHRHRLDRAGINRMANTTTTRSEEPVAR